MSADIPLKVAILWHMHQPNYQEPNSNMLVLPWVRLHALKDYLDMPLTAAEYERVQVTFNLVPSLLDQVRLYLSGGRDTHLELARLPADKLTEDQKSRILDTFFTVNSQHMIEPYPRYRELFRKMRRNVGDSVLPALFSSEEVRDLQVWSNLVWVDPVFRSEEPINTLFDKGRYFSEEDKEHLFAWQESFMARIIPTYRDLYQAGAIDLSFTPFYHPILPLLCDTDVAREALPDLTLPEHRFRHPEDARWQIRQSMKLFAELFGRQMAGMWPSEGSISEETAQLMSDEGLQWAASDEGILERSIEKSGRSVESHQPHHVYQCESGLKLFFRDRGLSDRIGFVYSSWDADRAADDFIKHLKRIRNLLASRLDESIVAIILDGENAWEHFPNDGRDFLQELYQRLNDDSTIETISMTQAASTLPARPLPRLFAGSWINHNFRIWIGHAEDNAAWDLLSQARNRLQEFQQNHPDFKRDSLETAWRQIYIAEGSDWCWWYGDEHRGAQNAEFDRIYRRHLAAVYESLDLDVPPEYLVPIASVSAAARVIPPDMLLTPTIDGVLTHFYEWAGSGSYDCLVIGSAMHRVHRYLSKMFFAYDHQHVYIRIDFADESAMASLVRPVVSLVINAGEPRVLDIDLDRPRDEARGSFRYCVREVLEVALDRDWLWPAGFGELAFTVRVSDGDSVVETEPEHDPIRLHVFERNQELFWP